MTTAYAHNTERSGASQDVPVILHHHESQPPPDGQWHLATDEEYQAYYAYWTEVVGPNGEERGEL